MKRKTKLEKFEEIRDQMTAVIYGQKNWTDENFLDTFGCSKKEALDNSIKIFHGQLFQL